MKPTKITRLLIAAFAVLTLSRCATSGSGEESLGADHYELRVYSAPWCENCKPFIHGLSDDIAATPPAVMSKISMTIHVVSGAAPSSKPTQAVADEYLAFLNVPFTAMPDYWRTGTLKDFYDISSTIPIPVAVVIPSTGPAKIFPPGTGALDVYSYLTTLK